MIPAPSKNSWQLKKHESNDFLVTKMPASTTAITTFAVGFATCYWDRIVKYSVFPNISRMVNHKCIMAIPGSDQKEG